MAVELVPLTFSKIMQSHSYTAIILSGEKKKIVVYMEPSVGKNIQEFLSGKQSARPSTQELINGLFQGFDIKVLQVVIHDIEDTIYFARLFLEQTIGNTTQILEIDARPSDCLPLVIIHNIPLFCRKEIFEKALSVEEN